MELFYAPNTISVATAIALEQARLNYTPRLVDFAQAAQTKAEYLCVNPKGRVPALVVGDDVLTETGALLEYVAGLAPEAGLIPANPMQAFRMREVMYYLATTMHVAHAHKLRGARWADHPESHADMTAKVPETMAACCAHLEETCDFAPFVTGAQMTLADIYLYVITTWLPGDGVTVANYPKLSRFIQAMSGQSAVKAVRAAGML